MIIIAKVHKIYKESNSKVKAMVSLIVSEPDEIINLRLFEIHEKNGVITDFETLKGKTISVPLSISIYNSKLSYSLSYGASIKPAT